MAVSTAACEREDWSILTWPRCDAATGEVEVSGAPGWRPFLCSSWRCRRCARWRGAVDWARVRGALVARSWWLYVVLTFDRETFERKEDAYLAAGRCWDAHLRQGLRRQAAPFEYVQTWEAHRSGWPHVNVILAGDRLRAWVEGLGVEERSELAGLAGERSRRCLFPRAWRRWLRAAAVRAGFGPRCWAEVVSSSNPDALAGYLVKLARELTGAPGGAKGGDQVPVCAPPRFRRIRASRGTLPPGPGADADPRWTGKLVRRRASSVAHPARRTGERAELSPATWADVECALALVKEEL